MVSPQEIILSTGNCLEIMKDDNIARVGIRLGTPHLVQAGNSRTCAAGQVGAPRPAVRERTNRPRRRMPRPSSLGESSRGRPRLSPASPLAPPQLAATLDVGKFPAWSGRRVIEPGTASRDRTHLRTGDGTLTPPPVAQTAGGRSAGFDGLWTVGIRGTVRDV
jgi:hypothetical protein